MTGRKHRKRKDGSNRREVSLTGDGGSSHYRSNPSVDESVLRRRRPHSPPSSPPALQDRNASKHHEIQSLRLDNQRLAATHVALKQELIATQQDIRHLSSAAAEIKVQRDIEVREIYEKSLKMDAEVRAIEAMSSDLVQVRADIHELIDSRKDLTSHLQAIESDLARVREESQQVPAIKADIEAMRHEIQRGRKAIEYEKKTYANNLEHSQTMDRNMIIMTREVEKLRVELSNAEKRARAAAAVSAVTVMNPSPGYPPNYDSPEMGYGGFAYSNSYGMHQIQGGANARPQYVSGAALHHHPCDVQHIHR